jgi:hypothetical protein
LHEAFQGELGGIEGQAVFDLIRDLLDPVVTLPARLGVLGDAFAAQANLGTPSTVIPLIDRAFVIASLFCHIHFSFL